MLSGPRLVSRESSLPPRFTSAISKLLLHRPRLPHVRGEYSGEDPFGREPLAAE